VKVDDGSSLVEKDGVTKTLGSITCWLRDVELSVVVVRDVISGILSSEGASTISVRGRRERVRQPRRTPGQRWPPPALPGELGRGRQPGGELRGQLRSAQWCRRRQMAVADLKEPWPEEGAAG
jgi:hypothetical protein